MALNFIWVGFFIIAFVIALVQLIFYGDTSIFPAIMNSTFVNAKLGFELSLGLTGVMTLWLGIMKIGEKGGAINYCPERFPLYFIVFFLIFLKIILYTEP